MRQLLTVITLAAIAYLIWTAFIPFLKAIL
jgi:hypothetical protein